MKTKLEELKGIKDDIITASVVGWALNMDQGRVRAYARSGELKKMLPEMDYFFSGNRFKAFKAGLIKYLEGTTHDAV